MKTSISVLVATFLLIFNLITPTATLSDGAPPDKKWKGEGEVIEFESIPVITIKDFLNGKIPTETKTIWGTLNFPANAADQNVPAVVIMHGGGGLNEWEEHWMETFNSIGLATFMLDSNWGRRKCRKQFKKAIPYCNDVHRGMTRIVDGYRALELLSKHPRIDPERIGCLGNSLGARGCLYLNVKRFQKMWGTPGLDYAASVPMYPPCNATFKDDDEITDTPIRIHLGELDTYFPVDSCVNYVARLKAKGKDVDIKLYPDTHHGFEGKIAGKKTWKVKGYNDGKCYYEENPSLPVAEMAPDDVAILSQIGFNEWYASATEKDKKKIFKRVKRRHKMGWRLPQVVFDKSCINNSTTNEYNEASRDEAERLVKEFFTATLLK